MGSAENKPRLITVEEFRQEFSPAGRPDPRTVRSWIKDGRLPGAVLGDRYYIQSDWMDYIQGDDLTRRVMEG